MVLIIDQIAVTDEGLLPVQIQDRPVFIDAHAMKVGEIPGQEKIVIALADMNGNTPGLEVLQYGDDFLESRVYLFPAAEPEIEEIPEDKKMIEDRNPGRSVPGSRRIRSGQSGKEFLQDPVMGLVGIPQMGVGKKQAPLVACPRPL